MAGTISEILNPGIVNLILNLASRMKYNNYEIVVNREKQEQISVENNVLVKLGK